MNFQAKDIQKVVGLPKHRYEYIASKLGITPDVEEVEGTGRSHLYSFKNLLQFAFVHRANKMSITPKTTKRMLGFLSINPELKSIGLFDPKKSTKVSLHCVVFADKMYFKISGESTSKQDAKSFFPVKGFERTFELLEKMKGIAEGETVTIPGVTDEIKETMQLTGMNLEDSDGYITINLGSIKDRILKKIAE